MVKWVGEKRILWAMGITGSLISIPFFVDMAYIVLQPITEALSIRSKKPVLVIGGLIWFVVVHAANLTDSSMADKVVEPLQG